MSLPRQFSRFLGVGAAATALMYALLILQVEGFERPPVSSSGIAYLLSSVFNYWANYHWTFASRQRHAPALLRFTLIAATGLLLNLALMQALTQGLGWAYLLAQILATALVLLWNFFANRHWTYQAAGKH